MALTELWRTFLRTQLTRVRLLVIVTGGIALVLLTATIDARAAGDVLEPLGLGLLVPLVTLVIASSTLGDLDRDGGLVYVWLPPVARWRLAAAAFLAVATIVVPAAVLPLTLAGLVAGQGPAAAGAGLAAGLAALAYGAVFLGLGLRVPRALVVGLVYVVLWESGAVAVSDTLGRVSVRWYAAGLLDRFVGLPDPTGAPSATGLGLLVITAGGFAATVWLLRRHRLT
ncbi:hypothetical protein ER308_18445 [Egibacter rhizosphaerae]|uniref:ABC transporter permease n=1 Tax=Egibacter rhizosphaerae TaxID=1670831 RepID=A0A411YJE0_9ACTN|nr:hypothetical protein [Egibacter rhizosphaerae]QBI21350.1 hypothetical protein ER308_18445 [Egibacter rhizosphaerae]